MAYSALADLLAAKSEETLVQLTDDAGTGVVDTAVVSQAIALADAKIDSYIGKKHAMPLSPVPDVVKDASVVLALCRLYDRRDGPEPGLDKRQDRVIAWLKDVAGGRATLGEDDPSGSPPSGQVDISSRTRVFDRDTLGNF